MTKHLAFLLFTLMIIGCNHIEKKEEVKEENSLFYETKFFNTSDGIKLRYLTSGNGPALVFQPGWMMPAELFTPQLEQLANSFRVIVLDPRGQGLSEDAPNDNYVDRRAKDIYELIEHEMVDSLILGGWSLGVIEILRYVEMYDANNLKGLILIDGPITTDDEEVVQPGWKMMVNRLQINRDEFEKEFMAVLFKKQPDSVFYELIENRLSNTPTNSSFVAIATHIAEPRDYSSVMDSIDVPTLVTLALWGFQLENYKKFKSNVSIEMFDAGHALFVDESERFNELVIELHERSR